MARFFLAAGSLAGAVAVAMAAIAAHALPPGMDAAGLRAIGSAVQLEGWHALAVVAVGLWLLYAPGRARGFAMIAGAGFLLGSMLFCGAIYAHHLAGLPTGPLAPVGGVILILSWLTLSASALFAPSTPGLPRA
jgi:uncharacterized membrane protein YgdD (TMEM256/DUF423 family)